MSAKTIENDLRVTHAKLLEEALARPGVRESMEIFEICANKEKELNKYQSFMSNSNNNTTVSSSSVSKLI